MRQDSYFSSTAATHSSQSALSVGTDGCNYTDGESKMICPLCLFQDSRSHWEAGGRRNPVFGRVGLRWRFDLPHENLSSASFV